MHVQELLIPPQKTLSAFHANQANELAAYGLAHQQCEEDEISKRLHPVWPGCVYGGKDQSCLLGSRIVPYPNTGKQILFIRWNSEHHFTQGINILFVYFSAILSL